MSGTHEVEVEARSYEIDAYEHLNHAVVVNWLEHARSRYLRERGLSWISLPDEYAVRVFILRLDITYRAEIRMDDRLRVRSRISKFGRSSFTFAQEVRFLDDRLAAEADVVVVCVDGEGRPATMPAELRERLED